MKMRKWSPWQPARKFAVAVRLMRLELSAEDDGGGGDDKLVAIKIKWKGEPKFFPLMPPFQPRLKIEQSSQRIMKKNLGIVEWDEESRFENTCCFSVVSDKKFGPWEIGFNVLCGEKMDWKAKTAVIGRVSINISEIVCKIESSSVEERLPLNLNIDGIARDATLTVLFNFVEIREAQDSAGPNRTKSVDAKVLFGDECKDNVKARRRSLSLEEVCLDELDESSAPEAKDTVARTKPRAPAAVLEPDKKDRWFSWKSKGFSFKRAKTKEEKSELKSENCGDNSRVQPTNLFNDVVLKKDDHKKCSSESDDTECVWEEKELISRDGKAKLKAPFFLASFDQRSDKAAGESACTVLVAVISHWLHSKSDAMPTRSEFDSLIMQGSSEWRKLCEDAAYVNDFPNKHFDLETVLRADIRPVSISRNESFVGFFGAEAFESLKGAMSFDNIWDEISSSSTAQSAPRVYIVSWNDHFFVLKAEANAYYIIDTLGERLHEGCHQAYIIRFDDKAIMQRPKAAAAAAESDNMDETEHDEVICSGKECCREFIKRFLAAIPLKELEEDEKKTAVSYFSLHQRLQIEFNYSCLISPASSSTSSPFSSLTTSASSPLSE